MFVPNTLLPGQTMAMVFVYVFVSAHNQATSVRTSRIVKSQNSKIVRLVIPDAVCSYYSS